jgi:hypothetical protein
MNLLEALANGNGRWCATVADETANMARKAGQEDMALAPGIFGDALLPESQRERIDIEAIRVSLAEPEDPAYKHLGEAETIVIISNRGYSAAFVSDDSGARHVAAGLGVTTYSTWDLLKLAYRLNKIAQEEFWDFAYFLRSKKRGWPPCGHNRQDFLAWSGS